MKVTKFEQLLLPGSSVSWWRILPLQFWRFVLYLLHLVGQDAEKVGYGNLSVRTGDASFYITGTQTGNHPVLFPRHYAHVVECRPAENLVVRRGPKDSIGASSESYIHDAAYKASPRIKSIVHAHSRTLWIMARAFHLPVTNPDASYGTPEMGAEFSRLLSPSPEGIVIMGGHEDGILCYGRSVNRATITLLGWWFRALWLRAF